MGVDAGLFSYEGKRVLVTGAASGMGEATAAVLGTLGAEVHTLDIRNPTVANAAFYETDLRDPSSIDAAVAALTADGPIDRLFNCAGIPQTFPHVEVMLVNFLGLRHLTDALLPHIVDGGAIASISSGAGIGWMQNMALVMELLAIPDFGGAHVWCENNVDRIGSGYAFSKECIIVWTQMRSMALAQERHIRINCIAPGPTDTGMMPAIAQDMGQEYMDAFPKPLFGRNATAAEQAWPLVALNSDALSVVSGTVLYTDQAFAGGLFTGQVDVSKIMGRVTHDG